MPKFNTTFRLKPLLRAASLSLVLVSSSLVAAETPVGYVARIQAHTPEEVGSILNRAEDLMAQQDSYSQEKPIALILHGEEAQAFLRSNYGSHKELVDLAAKLDAFNVIDVQICETWMSMNKVDRSEIPAFINTVPFGPAAEQALKGSGYLYF